ncbi:MAG: KH domain-containing protein [Thermoanaerobaculia bacterium]
MTLREELEGLVRLMVDVPDAVAVEELETAQVTVFEVRLAEEDLGKVIGRQGRTARAIRSLLIERGVWDGKRYEFEIVDAP